METKLIATVILLIAVTLSAFNNMSFIKQTANAQVSSPSQSLPNKDGTAATTTTANTTITTTIPTATSSPQTSLGDLTNQWWDWIFSLNIVKLAQQYNYSLGKDNPIFDKTGALCDAGIQRNGMLFLVGTGGVTTPAGQPIQEDTSHQRTCTTPIRQGTPILIPLINSECSPIEFGYDQNCNQPACSIKDSTTLSTIRKSIWFSTTIRSK